MSATNELRTARLTGTVDDGPDIPTALSNLEEALRTIFGVTADTVMAEAMQIDAAGDVTMTGTLTLAGAPSEDLEASTKAYADGVVTGWNPGQAMVRRTLTQSVFNNTWTEVTWAAEVFDTATMHDNSYDNAKIEVPDDGVYYCLVYLSLNETMSEGTITLRVYKNKNTIVGEVKHGFEDPYANIPWSQVQDYYYAIPHIRFEGLLNLEADDIITVSVHQDSGHTVPLGTGADETGFGVCKIRST